MLKNSLLIGLTAVCLSSATAPAQERVVRRVETTASGGREIHKLSVVMKSKVLIREDKPAGQIVDVVLSDGGCVEYLVATHEDKYYILPYQATEVRYADQVVFVDIAPAQFQKVQFFSQDRWPDVYSTEYRQQVNTVFNVRVDADSRTRVRDRSDRDVNDRNRDRNDRNDPNREAGDRNERDPRGAANRDNPARDARNRDDRDTAPRTDRTPREGDRPRAEDRGDNPNRPRTEDRDAAPRTPKANPQADSATPPQREPGAPKADRDQEKDEKPATPAPTPPKP